MSKILIVDDEPSFCKMLRRFLEQRGYEVVQALNGDDAVSIYDKEWPDAVLLDIKMPGKCGLETLGELKAIDPDINVIMLTAVQDEDIVNQAMAEGTFDYITKPVDPNYLELCLMVKFAMA